MKQNQRRLLACLILFFMAVPACGLPSQATPEKMVDAAAEGLESTMPAGETTVTPTPEPAIEATLEPTVEPPSIFKVVDRREIEEIGQFYSLSPDGKWLVRESFFPDGVCLRDANTLEEHSCVSTSGWEADEYSLAWSPDGSRLALTENSRKLRIDSDIWVLATESGRSINLTDDGVTKLDKIKPHTSETLAALAEAGLNTADLKGRRGVLIDTSPAWSPDGTELVFVRSAQVVDAEQGATALFRISASGGKPEPLVVVDDQLPGVVPGGIFWASDDTIFYSVTGPNPADNGIWTINLTDLKPQHRLPPDPELGTPVLLDVAESTDKALVVYYPPDNADPFLAIFDYVIAFWDLTTDQVEPFTGNDTGLLKKFPPLNAAFSPDGNNIIYTLRGLDLYEGGGFWTSWLVTRSVHEPAAKNTLFVVNDGPLKSDISFHSAKSTPSRRLSWADDGLIFASTYPGSPTGLLFTVEKEVIAAPQVTTTAAAAPADRLYRIEQGGKYGYINAEGQVVIAPQFEFSGHFVEGRAVVQVDGLIGYIDSTGAMVIEPQFDIGYDFSEGLALVKMDRKMGYIDDTGRMVVEPQFSPADHFSDGLALVFDGEIAKYIDQSGQTAFEVPAGKSWAFFEGLVRIQLNDGKWGFMDTTGRMVVEPQFDSANDFSDGLARVKVDGKWGYIDPTGQMVINPNFEYAYDFSEGLALVGGVEHWQYIDQTGKLVFEIPFHQPGPFSEGLARVADWDKKWGYIDQTGKLVIAPQFEAADDFSNGMARVQHNGQWAYIDHTGKVVWSSD